MKIKSIIQTAILSSVFSISQLAKAQCAQQVRIDIGELSEQLTQQHDDHILSPEMDLNKKYEYASDVLSSKTHILNYVRTRANGNTRRCYYQSNEIPELKAELKQTGRRSVELKMTADLETLTNDDEFYIYDNQIVMNQTLNRSTSLRRGSKAFNGTLVSRTHYEYSCGFIDCTYTNDDINRLATSGFIARWN